MDTPTTSWLRTMTCSPLFSEARKNLWPPWYTTTSTASQASPPCSHRSKQNNLQVTEVISVEKNKIHTTATTRSWDFLGLNYQMTGTSNGLLKGSNYGEDVIIGVVDTGIWPESRSFSDEGYGPIPSRWKGNCQLGPDWGSNNCSRKIIGARFYTAGVPDVFLKMDTLSPRDHNGHGTHCASTAAGSTVEAASFNGLAEGVARGGAPRARIAVYKSGWGPGVVGSAAVLGG